MPGAWILWGREPAAGTRPTRYEFPSQAELDAFLKGVDEACGWLDYETREDDTPVPAAEPSNGSEYEPER